MSATLDDIGAALVTAGVAFTAVGHDWKLYKGYIQDSPDRAICIYETGGMPPMERWALDYPGLQVRVRGKPDDYQATRAQLQAIFNALHEQEIAVGGAYVYIYCQQSGPVPLGQDENRRPSLAQNYRILRNRPT